MIGIPAQGDVMTTFNETEHQAAAPAVRNERIPRFGPATPYVVVPAIFAVSVGTWWALADQRWSLTGTTAPVVNCLLLWTILGFLFTGFTFGSWPFSLLKQPLAGIAQVAVNLLIGVGATLFFTRVVGSWDPTFSASAPAGAGYTATAFIVLVGFYAFALASTSWGGYPFESVPGPLASVAQFFLGAFLTVIGVLVLVYPNFNAQLAANAPIALPDALGWTYSSIVVVIVAAMQWQNQPWAFLRNRHARAAGAVVVTLGGGYLLMQVLEVVVGVVVPSAVQDLPTFSVAVETAQLGVCVSLWSLVLGLVVAPVDAGTRVASRAARTAVVAVLAVVTYVFFMRFLATSLLHFPAIEGNYGGDPLAFVDWTILLVLWHAVAFGGHLATRRRR
jgi:AAT family amino acid transporter